MWIYYVIIKIMVDITKEAQITTLALAANHIRETIGYMPDTLKNIGEMIFGPIIDKPINTLTINIEAAGSSTVIQIINIIDIDKPNIIDIDKPNSIDIDKPNSIEDVKKMIVEKNDQYTRLDEVQLYHDYNYKNELYNGSLLNNYVNEKRITFQIVFDLDEQYKTQLMENEKLWKINPNDIKKTQEMFRYIRKIPFTDNELYKKNIIQHPIKKGFVKCLNYLLKSRCYVNTRSNNPRCISWSLYTMNTDLDEDKQLEIIKIFEKHKYFCDVRSAVLCGKKKIFNYLMGKWDRAPIDGFFFEDKSSDVMQHKPDITSEAFVAAADKGHNDMFIQLTKWWLEYKNTVTLNFGDPRLINEIYTGSGNGNISYMLVNKKCIKALIYLVENNMIAWTNKIFEEAIYHENIEAVELVLKFGLDTSYDISDDIGVHNDPEFIKYILSKGFKFDGRIFENIIRGDSDLKRVDQNIKTMTWLYDQGYKIRKMHFLKMACQKSNIEAIKFGIEHGLKVTLECYTWGTLECIQYLMEHSCTQAEQCKNQPCEHTMWNETCFSKLSLESLKYVNDLGYKSTKQTFLDKMEYSGKGYDIQHYLLDSGCPYDTDLIKEAMTSGRCQLDTTFDERTNNYTTNYSPCLFDFVLENCCFTETKCTNHACHHIPYNISFILHGLNPEHYNCTNVKKLIELYLKLEKEGKIEINRDSIVIDTYIKLINSGGGDSYNHEKTTTYLLFLIDNGFELNWHTIYGLFKRYGGNEYTNYEYGHPYDIKHLLKILFEHGCVCPEHCEIVPCPHTKLDIQLFSNEIHSLQTNEERMNYILSGGMMDIPAQPKADPGCQCSIM